MISLDSFIGEGEDPIEQAPRIVAPPVAGPEPRFICGDVREVLRALPEKSVQCVVTSPPYWGLRDYKVEGQLGLEKTPEEYVAALVEVFREVRRVLRDDGTCWLNLGDSYAGRGKGAWDNKNGGQKEVYIPDSNSPQVLLPKIPPGLKPKDLVGIPWRVAFALQADGWYLRCDIVWSKRNPMPEPVRDRPTRSHEYVFLLTKSERYFYDADAVKEKSSGISGGGFSRKYAEAQPAHGAMRLERPLDNGTRNRRSVWFLSTQPYRGAHFATFPEKLVEPCILAGTSERGACVECGSPWLRIVEKPDMSKRPLRDEAKQEGERIHSGFNGYPQSAGQVWQNWRDENPDRTVGWKPTCDHQAGTVPHIVLDPFAGSGTVALVARRLGRASIGIDLKPEYIELARKRCGLSPTGEVPE